MLTGRRAESRAAVWGTARRARPAATPLKTRVTSVPWPLTPGAPGGRLKEMMAVPLSASTRWTSAAGCSPPPRKPPWWTSASSTTEGTTKRSRAFWRTTSTAAVSPTPRRVWAGWKRSSVDPCTSACGGGSGPRPGGARVGGGDSRQARDARDEHDEDFVFELLLALGGEEVPQEGDLAEAGPAADGGALGVLDDAAEDVHLALAQADVVLDGALAEDGLLDAADADPAGDRADLALPFQGDLAVRVHARGDVHVHAHVLELELRVHQRVGAP